MLSSIGCSLCMVVIAACLLEQTQARAAAAVAFMFLFIDSFGLGILPVSWSYSSEIQPLATRNTANAVGVAGRKYQRLLHLDQVTYICMGPNVDLLTQIG